MEMAGWWLGLLLGAAPLVLLAVWHFNDIWHHAALSSKYASSGRGGKPRLPPGHMGLPFFGESFALLWYFVILRRPDDFITSKKKRFGEGIGMYRTHLFGSPTILTCSPASNKFVLQSAENFGVKWPSEALVGPSSIGYMEGKPHLRVRTLIVTTVNQPSALRKIAPVVQPRLVAAFRSWAQKGTVAALPEIKKVTFENICKMFVSMEPSPLTDQISEWFAGLIAGFRASRIDLPGTAYRHALQCRKKLTAVFREELERRKNSALGDEEKNDVMSGLMQIKDEEGKQLSDDEVVDNIVSLVFAGYESTAVSIMWALYHLSKSPDALRKLRDENIAISKKKNGDFVTVDDISQMKYTAKVVEETIRLANVSAMLHRTARKDVEYEGHTIPKGWNVVVWIRTQHIDANYFDDPLSFSPERWDNPAKPGTYQVFGGGPRICPGNMLARMQLSARRKLAISREIRRLGAALILIQANQNRQSARNFQSAALFDSLGPRQKQPSITWPPMNPLIFDVWNPFFWSDHRENNQNMPKVAANEDEMRLNAADLWELLNPDAKMSYLPHPRPEDGVALSFHTL